VAGDGYGAGILNPEWCVSRAWQGFDSLVPLEQIPKRWARRACARQAHLFILALSALSVGRDAVIPVGGALLSGIKLLSLILPIARHSRGGGNP
jgi:hypothetical protein